MSSASSISLTLVDCQNSATTLHCKIHQTPAAGQQLPVPQLWIWWYCQLIGTARKLHLNQKWWDLFAVAVNAKHAISVHELLRTTTGNQSRQTALINNLNKHAAERKLQSMMILLLGWSGRENPYITLSPATLTEPIFAIE